MKSAVSHQSTELKKTKTNTIMSFIQKLLSGSAGEVITAVGTTLDKLITTPGERMQLELEMKKAGQQYDMDMKRLSVEEEKVFMADRDSARRRDADVQGSPNATRLSKNVSAILALGTTVLTFSLFGLLIFNGESIDQDRREITIYILGVLSAVLTQVFGFYFGSSQGSAEKNATIKELKVSG